MFNVLLLLLVAFSFWCLAWRVGVGSAVVPAMAIIESVLAGNWFESTTPPLTDCLFEFAKGDCMAWKNDRSANEADAVPVIAAAAARALNRIIGR